MRFNTLPKNQQGPSDLFDCLFGGFSQRVGTGITFRYLGWCVLEVNLYVKSWPGGVKSLDKCQFKVM